VYIKGQSTQNGQTIQRFSTFGDRIDKILHLIEIIIDRDVYLASKEGIKIPQTLDRRSSISGFDLMDLIKPLGPIGTRIAHMNSWGDGWVDLFHSIGVTTIFGRGFGELIRPDEPDQICSNWRSIPIGLDYMAVSTSTLKMIYDKRLQRLTTTLGIGELTSNTLWMSPCHPFEPCNCIETNVADKQNHLDPVQFLISKNKRKPSRKPKDMALIDVNTLNTAGAVVFANLSLLGRRKNTKVVDRTVNQLDSKTPLTISSDSSQASDLSTSAFDMTQSAGSTNITTPSEDIVKDGDQKNEIENSKAMSGVKKLQQRWDTFIRKK